MMNWKECGRKWPLPNLRGKKKKKKKKKRKPQSR
jgi:hypothetical protein